MGFTDTGQGQLLVAGSLFDAVFACVIYTLGRSLVAAKDIQLDLKELLRRCDANLRSSVFDVGRLWTVCGRYCAARLPD